MTDYVTGVAPNKGKDPATAPAHAGKAARHPAPKAVQGKRRVAAAEKSARKSQVAEQNKPTLEELREMLRKINLTFDLFEIAAEYTIDEEANRVKVVVHNTRTGKVIRRIPPEIFITEFYDMKRGLGMRINASA